METEESLTVPGQANNNHHQHQQLPDTSSIRNYNSDLHSQSLLLSSQSVTIIGEPHLPLQNVNQCGPLSLVKAQRGLAFIGQELRSVATPLSLMP